MKVVELFSHIRGRVLSVALALVVAGPASQAYQPKAGPESSSEMPREFQNVGITEHLGDSIDLNLQFRNEEGDLIPLGQIVKGDRPIVLSLVYYNCASLCNLHLNGLTDAFKDLNWTAGRQFDAVAVSIDPAEKPALAKPKKDAYLKEYGRPEAASGWHFLTGDEGQIKALADSVGFKYQWNESAKEWAHASAAIVLTPEGRISRYLHGMYFEPQTLRLALLEASNGKIGTIVDQFIMFCFQYDPKASKYTLYAYNIMRMGGGATLLILLAFLAPFWIRQRRATRRLQGEG